MGFGPARGAGEMFWVLQGEFRGFVRKVGWAARRIDFWQVRFDSGFDLI